MSNNKIIVSKSGFNALTETDPNNFIFHTDYNTFKILAEGNLTSQTVSSNPTTFTFEHGLSYVPNFFAFCEFPDGYVALPNSQDFTAQFNVATGYGEFTAEVDDTYLYFILSKYGSNYNVNLRYYIFEAVVL